MQTAPGTMVPGVVYRSVWLRPKPPLQGEGDRRRRWRGAILTVHASYRYDEISWRYHPSVCVADSSPLRGAMGAGTAQSLPLEGRGTAARRWWGAILTVHASYRYDEIAWRQHPSVCFADSSPLRGAMGAGGGGSKPPPYGVTANAARLFDKLRRGTKTRCAAPGKPVRFLCT